ncbi:MAG TPA: hypothetical protein VM054_08705 [bacterium]|nr:hypothetical protein [bacterium]
MRLWVGLPVPDKPGQYDLRPVEVSYTAERLRRLNRFPLLLSFGLTVLFGAAAAVLAGVPEEIGAGWALGVMAVGCAVSAVVFFLQLHQRSAMRREPEKFARRAYLAFDAEDDEAAFTEDELAERTG